MPQVLLKIHWVDAQEYLWISTGSTGTVDTFERFSRGTIVYFRAKIEQFAFDGDLYTLRLKYTKEALPPKTLSSGERCSGIAEITWRADADTGQATWTDDEDSDYNGTVTVTVSGQEEPAERVYKDKSVIIRPAQSVLRGQLFLLDRECVITGEKQADVLDAAHIVPVKSNGKEVVSNAMLLRTDIHRLFDAGLIWFKRSGGRALVQYRSDLTVHYCDLLRDKSPPKATFRGVEEALQLRSGLPDGTPKRSPS